MVGRKSASASVSVGADDTWAIVRMAYMLREKKVNRERVPSLRANTRSFVLSIRLELGCRSLEVPLQLAKMRRNLVMRPHLG